MLARIRGSRLFNNIKYGVGNKLGGQTCLSIQICEFEILQDRCGVGISWIGDNE